MNTFKNLKEIAKELNEVLVLNPPIDYIRTTIDKLENEVKKAAELIQPGMQFRESTLEYLYEIHAEIGKTTRSYVIIDKEKKTKKGKITDCFSKDYDRKSHLCQDCVRKEICRRKYRQALDVLKYIKEGGIQRVDIGPISYRYTKDHALIDALKIGGTKKEIIEMANELYMKKGGDDNKKPFEKLFPIAVRLLGITKILRIHEDFYLLRNI